MKDYDSGEMSESGYKDKVPNFWIVKKLIEVLAFDILSEAMFVFHIYFLLLWCCHEWEKSCIKFLPVYLDNYLMSESISWTNNGIFWYHQYFKLPAVIPDICHLFTPTHFEAWKFYTQKRENSRQKFTRDKTA